MSVIRQTVQVLTGHQVEIVAPELTDGDWVEVVVSLSSAPARSAASLLKFIDSLPPGLRAASDWNEYEAQLRQDHESWICNSARIRCCCGLCQHRHLYRRKEKTGFRNIAGFNIAVFNVVVLDEVIETHH